MEMGAPFEGDTAGRGLLDPMPDWVATQIDMADYVDYLKAPVGTWDGKTYRVSVDGDTHTLAYRTDYYADPTLTAAWTAEGHAGDWAPPTTWEQVNEQSKFLAGKTDPLTGSARLRHRRPAQVLLGRLRLLLPGRPRRRLLEGPGQPGLAVRPGHDEAAREQPRLGAGDPGRDRPPEHAGRVSARPDQRGPEHDRVPAVPGRHRRAGHVVGRCGLQRQDLRHLGRGPRGRLRHRPRRGPVLRLDDGRLGGERQPGSEQRLHRLGRLRHQPRLERRAEAQVHVVGCGPPGRQGPVALDGGLSVRLPAVPQLALQHRRVGRGRLRPAFIEDYLSSNADSYNHPNAANEPRIPGIFQYYSRAEDELVQGSAAAAPRRSRSRTTSRRAGRRSPTRSVATASSSCTGPRSGCSDARGAR